MKKEVTPLATVMIGQEQRIALMKYGYCIIQKLESFLWYKWWDNN